MLNLSLRLLATFVILALAAGARAHTPNPRLDGGDNSWQLVDSGSVTAHANITSYSGGWYDPVHHALCLFGGGHWDYSGNEVWCLDIDKLTWSELYAPDEITDQGEPQGAYDNFQRNFPGALFNPAGEPIGEANPVSRHTYDQLEFVDGLGPIAFGGYTWGDSGMPWCFLCGDTWVFDQSTTRWTYLGGRQSPDWVDEGSVGGSAYSTTDGRLYTLAAGATWMFDPARNTWQQLNTSGYAPYSIEHTMEYDPRRNVIYLLGGLYEPNHDLWRFDVASGRWSRLDPAGTGPTRKQAYWGPGLAFDTANDVLLVYQGSHLWAYHPDENRWEKPVLREQRPQEGDYVFGRFRYDPINGGAWLHAVQDDVHKTWFYRYRRSPAAAPPQPIVSMSVSPPIGDGRTPSTLSWSAAYATECKATGAWKGQRAVSASESIGVVSSDRTFVLECSGPGGNARREISIGPGGSAARKASDAGGGRKAAAVDTGLLAVMLSVVALLKRSER